jgi:hypothetical protein
LTLVVETIHQTGEAHAAPIPDSCGRPADVDVTIVAHSQGARQWTMSDPTARTM